MPKKRRGKLKADLFLLDEDHQSFTDKQILLLNAVNQCGSITQAAKHVGISYKTAWDRINMMNNLSEEPIVRRSVGGSGGGGGRVGGGRVGKGWGQVAHGKLRPGVGEWWWVLVSGGGVWL